MIALFVDIETPSAKPECNKVFFVTPTTFSSKVSNIADVKYRIYTICFFICTI